MTKTAETPMNESKIAIVGAGISGLSCASELCARGYAPTIFDRGRGPGGRVSTRLVTDSDLAFDHGAPSFRATHPEFQHALSQWIHDGVCEKWMPSVMELSGSKCTPVNAPEDLYVAVPRMNALPKHLASKLPTAPGTSDTDHAIMSGMSVLKLINDQHQWSLKMNHPVDGPSQHSSFDAVVLAVPPGNAMDLLDGHSAELSAKLRAIPMRTTWVLMLAIDSQSGDDPDNPDNPDNPDYPVGLPDVLQTLNHPRIEKIVSMSTKPARPDSPRCYTVYAHHDWSIQNRESEFEPIRQQLLADTLALISQATNTASSSISEPVIHSSAHRWGYAEPVNAAAEHSNEGYICDESNRIVVCNDAMAWESRELGIQSAWISGKSAASCIHRILYGET
ncbi:MAG: NAD(P)/FAD-dependent oxidoreductase [Phycisphaerales bacterium]